MLTLFNKNCNKNKQNTMKQISILILFYFSTILQTSAQCDIGTTGLTVMNSANTDNIGSICIGQKAILKFSIANFGTDPSCVIPINTAKATLSLPPSFSYAGLQSFSSGYFTWTYNSTNRTLVGYNTTALSQYYGDSVLVSVVGVVAASQTTVLNILQLQGLSDNTGNNTSSSGLTVVVAPVATISYPSGTYCPTGTAIVTQTGQAGGYYVSSAGLSINTTSGLINLTSSSAGTYTIKYVFSNTACTDTATARVVVKAKSTSTTNVAICSTQTPYNWHGVNYTTSGTYTWTGVNSVSCDSIAILNLVVSQPVNLSQTVTFCNSYQWNGTTYTQSGNYTYPHSNPNGCQTVDTLHLTINRSTYNSTTQTSCNSFLWNGTTYTQTGLYTYAYANNNSCSSVDTLRLTINRSTYNSTTQTSCNSYIWNGTTYTQSGIYTFSYLNGSACPSVDTLRLTINRSTYNSTSVASCNSYMWNGITYTQSGTYTFSYSNGYGCASMDTLKFTKLISTSSTTAVTICSNQLPYLWNGTTYNMAGTYTKTILNMAGCDSVMTLMLSLTTIIPSMPASITQTLVVNACGGKIYRYTASATSNATDYSWQLPVSVGGVSGVIVDSGNASSSRIIRIKYLSNNAALTTDSIFVMAHSPCGSSARKAAKLTNTLLASPATPMSITISAIQTNVCGAKKYRYSAPALPVATATVVAATGYIWSFTGTLGANAVIDSGTINSQIIQVRFTNNLAAATGDSIKLLYTSSCGNTANKAAKLTNTLLSAPATPSSITITGVQTNECGARIYRYSAPALPLGSGTAVAATGYLWSFTGALGANAVIDSGNINSQSIVVRYTNNIASVAGDSARVSFTSLCGNSTNKSAKLTNSLLASPAAPASITISAIQANVCGAKLYRYTAPTLPAATSTLPAATGYLWSFTGALGANAVLDSGSLGSQVIIVRFSTNDSASNIVGSGDSVKLRYLSKCGNSLAKSLILTNKIIKTPSAPSGITIALVSDICSNRIYRYTAPVLAVGTTTAAPATGYQWSLPTGTLGLTGVLDSGSLSGKIIRIKYSGNTAAAAGDSIRVQFTSSCGIGAVKSQKLSNIAKTGCPLIAKSKIPGISNRLTSPELQLFPNPFTSQFEIRYESNSEAAVEIVVRDILGKLLQIKTVAPNFTTEMGANLNKGIYIIEARQGNKSKYFKAIKL